MHLLVSISSHGFGHAGQTVPVVNALRERLPQLRVTVRTALDRDLIAKMFHGAISHIIESTDLGMVMASAIEVCAEESAAAYARFHEDWERKVAHEAGRLERLAPDLMLANIPYLTLAGAARAGIRAVGLCSLNWADIYRHYCGGRPEADRIHAQILAAYRSAAAMLLTEPSMPMSELPNRRPIGPVARRGADRRAQLRRRLGLADNTRMVNIAPGGMPLRLPLETWPRRAALHWIVPASWGIARADITPFESLGMSFPDALRSSDVLVGKPGYGSFSEAACNGIPVLYVRRHDWPEEPYLTEWLAQHGQCREIERYRLETGELEPALAALWSQPPRSPVAPTGIAQAADYLAALLCKNKEHTPIPVPHGSGY